MTIKDFLELLDPEGWRMDADGYVMDGNGQCPLWHVYHGLYDDWNEVEMEEDYVEAGRKCGLRSMDAIAIADAADKRGHPRLRKRLLASVGLDES